MPNIQILNMQILCRAAVEQYRLRFPHRRTSDKNVFIRVYNKLCEFGMLPSARITSERASLQDLDEVDNILGLVDDPTTTLRSICTQLGNS